MLRISVFLFLLVGISLIALGAIYLSADEFMPYHARAVDADWQELDANSRGLILGLLKGLGAGSLVTGAAILFMAASSFRTSPLPYRTLLPLVATAYSSLLCYATYTVSVSTPGDPPLLLTLLLVFACLLASVMFTLAVREHGHPGN